MNGSVKMGTYRGIYCLIKILWSCSAIFSRILFFFAEAARLWEAKTEAGTHQ